MSTRFSLLICALLLASCATAQAPTPAPVAQNAPVEAGTPTEICDAHTPAADPANRSFDQPDQVLEEGVDYRAILCTDVGPVYVDLFEAYTPITVNSFIFLAQQGFYNNTTFHRVIADFMAQGGDPTGTGTGGPGYNFGEELVGFLNFDKPGWLAMANRGANTNSDGSQFFITTAPATHLDYNYTIFGEVLEGQENVDAIKLRDPETATEPGTGLKTVVIVEDPTLVRTTYVPPERPDEDAVAQALAGVSTILPPDSGLSVDESTSGVLSTDEVVALQPEEVQGDYSALLEANHHEYRASSTVVNNNCDLDNYKFVSIAYRLDSFASAEDAAAALKDDAWANATTSAGFTAGDPGTSGLTVYSKSEQSVRYRCHHRSHLLAARPLHRDCPGQHPCRRCPADAPPLDSILINYGGSIYERLLSPILRAELR